MLFIEAIGETELLNRTEESSEHPERITRRAIRERNHLTMATTEQFNDRLNDEFITMVDSDALDRFVLIVNDPDHVDDILKKYLTAIGRRAKSEFLVREMLFEEFSNSLSRADGMDYILDDDMVLSKFGLGRFHRFSRSFGENLIEEIFEDENGTVDFINKNLLKETMLPEIERIRKGRTGCSKATGHPVHYMLEFAEDRNELRRETYRTLLSELYAHGRIMSRRYSYVDIDSDEDMELQTLDAVYRASKGGTMVIRFKPAGESSDDTVTNSTASASEMIAELVKKYRNEVLTVISIPCNCGKAKEDLLTALGDIRLIGIREDIVFDDDARAYLVNLAKEHKIRPDKTLYAELESGKGYYSKDLCAIFERFFDNKLRNSIYSQYTDTVSAKSEVKEAAPIGSAYDRLQEMIGLTEAKTVINKALSYYKAQKLFADRGRIEDKPCMHMVFEGNPGSAKTTVARLFAQIMKDNGLLSTGAFVEVGRGDLVAKYVGHSAIQTRNAVKRALGGVLFVDEAYSLVDDRDGSFGDEVINTLVAEMENHRTDLIVIFAGYPRKMEQFLDKNPGLRSRIAFHVPFEDYNSDELVGIADLMLRKKKMNMTPEAEDKLRGLFTKACRRTDFGNGRFVRNCIEQALMAQSERLLSLPMDKITDSAVFTLTADDFSMPGDLSEESAPRQHIGFCA